MTAPISTPSLGAMDRPRASARRGKGLLVVAIATLVVAVLFIVTRRPANQTIERSGVVIDTARRGPFVSEIAAAGTLVAEQARLIAAPVSGRVESIRVQPGDRLRKGDLILELRNRETLRELLEAEQEVAGAEADLADLRATLQAASLDSAKALHHTKFEKRDADRQSDAAAELSRRGLIPDLEAIRKREAAEELSSRVASESQRHDAIVRSAEAQLAAQRNRLERLNAMKQFHRGLVDSLAVRAPGDTTVRDVAVQEGEWVAEGQRLVRVVEPGRLKCVLLVPEAAAHDVRIGQQVAMNARGTSLHGTIVRIAAAVEQGTLPVEVRLEGDIPPEARPELSVEGRIEISRLADALTIARPANARPAANGTLYKLDPNARIARRTGVVYGPAGVDRIVIARGASAGDRFVIAGVEAGTEPVVRLK